LFQNVQAICCFYYINNDRNFLISIVLFIALNIRDLHIVPTMWHDSPARRPGLCLGPFSGGVTTAVGFHNSARANKILHCLTVQRNRQPTSSWPDQRVDYLSKRERWLFDLVTSVRRCPVCSSYIISIISIRVKKISLLGATLLHVVIQFSMMV